MKSFGNFFKYIYVKSIDIQTQIQKTDISGEQYDRYIWFMINGHAFYFSFLCQKEESFVHDHGFIRIKH